MGLGESSHSPEQEIIPKTLPTQSFEHDCLPGAETAHIELGSEGKWSVWFWGARPIANSIKEFNFRATRPRNLEVESATITTTGMEPLSPGGTSNASNQLALEVA